MATTIRASSLPNDLDHDKRLLRTVCDRYMFFEVSEETYNRPENARLRIPKSRLEFGHYTVIPKDRENEAPYYVKIGTCERQELAWPTGIRLSDD